MKKALWAAGTSPEFWAAIKKGRIHIPGETIRPFVEEALAEEEGVRLRGCAFHEDGITLEIRVKKAGSRLTLPLAVNLEKMALNREEQVVEVRLGCEKPVGNNLLGRLAAAVAKGLVVKIMADRMRDNHGAKVSTIDGDRRLVMVDFSELRAVRKLGRKLPFIDKSVLDLVSVAGVKHVANAVELALARPGRGS